jgi:CDGSH-type Zn-finger protein
VTDPTSAKNAPIPVEVVAGATYFWCSCGRSAQQPFCDGSHRGSSFAPLKYTAKESATLYFCGCKRTGSPPLCDGSQQRLPAAT